MGEEIQVKSLLESEANQQHELDKFNRVDLLAVDSQEIQYPHLYILTLRWPPRTMLLAVDADATGDRGLHQGSLGAGFLLAF